jgi:glycosyltransferase involved in cell wall biosynthesis
MPSPLNVLMTTDAVGGVWTYTIELAEALCVAGASVTLAILGPEPSDAQFAQAVATRANIRTLDAPLDWLAQDEADVAKASHAITALARQTGADLVQVHSPALLAHASMPAPVVSVIHSCVATWWDAVHGGDMPEDLLWRARLVQDGLKRATINIAPSHSFAAAVARLYEREPPIVVHNARKTAPVAQSSPAPFVLSAGRFWDHGKNLTTLDEAAASCALPIIVAGPLTSPDGECVTPMHVDARGALPPAALQALLAQRPVFCSTAVYEPFGLAVLEAAQAGCALVLSDIPTFRELWGDAALFTSPRDACALADALNALALDHDRRAKLGEAARKRATQFTPERQARAMTGTYEDALRATGAEAAA